MRVLFFISVHGHGRGGHFHSLNHISNAIAQGHKVGIISIGAGSSPIIEKNPFFMAHIFYDFINYFTAQKEILKILRQFDPEIIHFFDTGSYNVFRFLNKKVDCKIVLNKCGGPNPKVFPSVDNLIVFSQENYYWFHKNSKFKNSRIFLIPNRVASIRLDTEFNSIQKVPSNFNFVRICRIGPFHKKSIEDSISLVLNLHSRGLKNVNLYVVGAIEDQQVLQEMQNLCKEFNNFVHFICAPKFTSEAVKMLYLADAVIGTGRSFMEAASLGLPLLTINSNDNFPTLIDSGNYDEAFRTNFSERNKFEKFDQKHNLKCIEMLVRDESYRKSLSDFSKLIFEKYFNDEQVLSKYTDVYNSAISSKVKISDYFYGLIDSIVFFKSARRRKI